MGDEWFGQDVDKIFAYQTPRVVKIYDRTLGLVKNVLMVLIFFYICIFNIWYKGAHFAFSPVEGLARLQWQEPTNRCNPLFVDCDANYHGIAELPYCKGYTGNEPHKNQRACDYYDARELPVNIGSGVLLPTFLLSYTQARTCPQGAPTCSGKWKYVDENGKRLTGTGYPKVSKAFYVADAEDFTLLIDHTFRTGNGKMRKDDFQMQGYYKKGDGEAKPIKCVHDDCEKMGMHTQGASASFLDFARSRWNGSWAHTRAQSRRPGQGQLSVAPADGLAVNFAAAEAEEAPQVIAIQDGDVLSLKTLLDLAGTSLNDPVDTGPGDTVRYRGIALAVNIRYENLVRWTLFRPNDPPWYTITVNAMPADTFKYAEVIEHGSSEGKRDMKLSYGTMIIVTQSGSMAFFDPMFALIAMTSAMALLAVSSTLTELLMLNVLPRKDEYSSVKFLESGDFSGPTKKAEAAAGQ